MGTTIFVAMLMHLGWAQEWEPETLRPMHTEEGVLSVRVVQWDGHTSVVAVGDFGVEVFDAADGRSVRRLVKPFKDAVVMDLDQDELSDLLLCGDGLWAWSGAVRELMQVVDTPCDHLAVLGVSDDADRLVVSGQPAYVMSRGKGEGIRVPLEPGMPNGSRVDVSGGSVARWHPDSSDWVLWDPSWSATVSAETVVGGVAMGPAGWAWLENQTVFELGGGEYGPILDASSLSSNGHLLVAAQAKHNRATVLGPTPFEISLPVRPDHLVVGELNGDDCPDLVALSSSGDGVRVFGACTSAEDKAIPSVELTVELPSDEPPSLEESQEAEAVSATGEQRLAIQAEWTSVEAIVGEPLELRLYDPKGRARSFSIRAGPSGLDLEGDLLSYTPLPVDVGLWRVKVRVREGADAYWTGIDLTVKEAP